MRLADGRRVIGLELRGHRAGWGDLLCGGDRGPGGAGPPLESAGNIGAVFLSAGASNLPSPKERPTSAQNILLLLLVGAGPGIGWAQRGPDYGRGGRARRIGLTLATLVTRRVDVIPYGDSAITSLTVAPNGSLVMARPRAQHFLTFSC